MTTTKTVGRQHHPPDETDEDTTEDALQKHADAARSETEAKIRELHDAAVEKLRRQIDELPEKPDELMAVRLTVLVQRRGTHYAELELLQRFYLGVIARRITASSRRGDGVIDRLSKATGYDPNTLRICRRAAVKYTDNVVLFARWMRSLRHKRKGSPARWGDVMEMVNVAGDPTVIGAEAHADMLIRRTENAAADLDKLAGSDEVESARIMLSESAARVREEGMRRLADAESDAVDAIPRSEAFLEFTRMRPCVATGQPPPDDGWSHVWVGEAPGIEAHHVDVAGTAIKGSDYLAIPLSPQAHALLHHRGFAAFKQTYNVDLRNALIDNMHSYFTGQPAQLPSALINL